MQPEVLASLALGMGTVTGAVALWHTYRQASVKVEGVVNYTYWNHQSDENAPTVVCLDVLLKCYPRAPTSIVRAEFDVPGVGTPEYRSSNMSRKGGGEADLTLQPGEAAEFFLNFTHRAALDLAWQDAVLTMHFVGAKPLRLAMKLPARDEAWRSGQEIRPPTESPRQRA